MKNFIINSLLSMKYEFMLEVIENFSGMFRPEELHLRLSDIDLSTSEGQSRFSNGEYLDDLTYDYLLKLSPSERNTIFRKIMVAI